MESKIVLITGASSDIGKSLATFYAKQKAKLILTYCSNKNDVIDFANQLINKYQVDVFALHLDLRKEESIIDVYNCVKEKYRKIDILINNAALSMDSDIIDKTKTEFMQVLEINVVGTFLMMKYFDNIIDGYIFNMASTDGIDTGNIYSIDYNASKAGIISLTKTFALYSQNKVICLCPNWVNTKSTKSMDKTYLQNELKRIKQDKLIDVETIAKVIDNCINNNLLTGSILRIEGDEDVRRID